MFYADAKSQVSIEYDEETPVAINTVLVSVSHSEELEAEQIYKDIKENGVYIEGLEELINDLLNDLDNFYLQK